MPKKNERTIVQAIKEVMTDKGRPMSAKEIHNDIVKANLYQFKAKNPVHIVNSQIRRHCKGLEQQSSYSKTKYFYEPKKKQYFYLDEPFFLGDPKDSSSVTDPSQKDENAYHETIKSITDWFLSEFEPLYGGNSKSFEDSEYIDVIDGPYSTMDVVKDKFWDTASPKVIAKTVEKLEDDFECFEWSKIPKDRDINNYYIENLGTDLYREFKIFIGNITKLSRPVDGPYTLRRELESPLNRMLYANIITAMESYLSDAFKKIVLSREDKLRLFVETTKEFQHQKISLSDIFNRMDKIKQEVSDYLSGISFHNIGKVEALYKGTLGIDFPRESTRRIHKAIAIRHDIVHRNGKNNDDGKLHEIDHEKIQSLSTEVNKFLRELDKQLRPLLKN